MTCGGIAWAPEDALMSPQRVKEDGLHRRTTSLIQTFMDSHIVAERRSERRSKINRAIQVCAIITLPSVQATAGA